MKKRKVSPPPPNLTTTSDDVKAPPPAAKRALLQTLLALSIVLLGLTVFSRGFFPVKSHLKGYAAAPARAGGVNEEPPFDRLVFMMVDALRSDFVFSSSSPMAFAQQLISSGQALPYTALSQPPTVTLPRLKALTIGSNPTFLDAMLNLSEDDGTAALEEVDSWVRQMAMMGKKMVFAGDDTWLRMFPEKWWDWSEGVTSFFVSDTVTVDTNVTRYLDSLLSHSNTPSVPPNDWDVLVLHYLGLDHVGHLGGPTSPLMEPKLIEMDGILERLFESLTRRDQNDGKKSLLVMVGDHGMTAMGNHGGSSAGETAAALLLASPSVQGPPPAATDTAEPPSDLRYHEVVNQIDLVPTLAALFHFGIPKNSMGRTIISAVEHFFARTSNDLLSRLLLQNSHQLSAVLEATAPGSVNSIVCSVTTSRLGGCLDSETRSLDTLVITEELSAFTLEAQDRLLRTFGDYHINNIIIGLLLLFVGTSGLTVIAWPTLKQASRSTRYFIGLAVLVYFASFFATSFIEEEHEFWYYFATSLVFVLAMRPSVSTRNRMLWVTMAATIRIMRSWSHNGQKDTPNLSISAYLALHPSLSDTSSVLTLAFHPVIVFLSLATASLPKNRGQPNPKKLLIRALSFSILLLLSFAQTLVAIAYCGEKTESLKWLLNALAKLDIVGPVMLARIGYAIGGIAWGFSSVLQGLDEELSLYLSWLKLSTLATSLITLSKLVNVGIFTLIWTQVYCMSRIGRTSPLLRSTLIISLQQVTFFAFGGSNSLATVDLSQAYNGISSYSLPLVTLQAFISNFSGPIFFSLATPLLLASHSPNTRTSLYPHFILASNFRSLSLFVLASSATHFRRHLFTWTVFSPALLYKGVWMTFVLLGADGLLAVFMSL